MFRQSCCSYCKEYGKPTHIITFIGLFGDPDRVCNECATTHENFSDHYKELLDINMIMSIDEYESIMMGG